MDEHWRDTVETRGIDAWETIAYPANAPLTMRPDWREARADSDPVKAAQGDARPLRLCARDLQLPVPGPGLPRREPGRRLRARRQRLAGGRMAGQGCAPARLGRPSHAIDRARGGGDRAPRRRSALRAGADAGVRRAAARQVGLLADLCRRRAPRLHGRHPRRLELSPRRHRLGLAQLLPRGLRRPVARLPHPARQPRSPRACS